MGIEYGYSRETVKVSSNYRVTIPKNVRRLLKIKEGDLVAFEIRSGMVILKKARIEVI